MKSFIEAQFGNCPLVWMFRGGALSKKINHLLERSLRVLYRDSTSPFHELLQKIILSLITTETFKVWLSNYIK